MIHNKGEKIFSPGPACGNQGVPDQISPFDPSHSQGAALQTLLDLLFPMAQIEREIRLRLQLSPVYGNPLGPGLSVPGADLLADGASVPTPSKSAGE
jgi:hypothetical protein